MDYLFLLDDSKDSMDDRVKRALEFHYKKYGLPANVLEMSIRDEPLPEGLELVVRVQRVNIPKDHFLLGVE